MTSRHFFDRRAWLAASLGLLATPLLAQAQQKVFRIGLLGGSSPTSPEASHVWAAFFEGLRELGYVEGRNITIENRFCGDRIERLPALAAELVQLRVDVIVAAAPPAPEAARRATQTIPIVMLNHNDPVASGLVASLARPAGNVTGMSLMTTELRGKQLQLLKESVSGLERVAVLSNPSVAQHALDLKLLEVAARTLKVQLQVVEARAPEEFADAYAAAIKRNAGAILVLGGAMYFAHRARLVQLSAEHRLPAIYPVKEYVEAGGLLAYGADLRDTARRAAAYVDKILKGAKPADLPVEQPTRFELAINLKTAKALGLKIPYSVRLRANEVIE
jgi:putative ABC transport system substrate-binding protein